MVYAGSYPHADTFFTVGDGRVEEFILLHSPQAPTTFRYRILEMAGVTTLRERDGVMEFLDADGRARLRIAKPYLVDGARQRDEERLTWEIAEEWLTLHLDAEGLVYPVLVDPEWESQWTYYAFDEHTVAVGLPNGLVLLVGSDRCAILFDPQTETWELTGSMNEIRNLRLDLLLLPDGKVLVVGGNRSAELYDPETGTWSYTGSTNGDRYCYGSYLQRPTLTLLLDGTALVTGGCDSTTAELYNPVTGIWSYTGLLNILRLSHTAMVLPNGKVLVTGGRYAGNSAELYDPDTQTWNLAGAMNEGRYDHIATLLPNGKVLVAGYGNMAELYDPVSGTWSDTSAMHLYATLLHNGDVLVTGGTTLTVTEIYDPIQEGKYW